jgi:hypothetical protein
VCAHRWVVCACVCVCVHWKTNDWLDGNIIEVGVAVFCFFLFVREITKTTTKEKSSNYFASTFFWSNRVALIGEVRNSFGRREKRKEVAENFNKITKSTRSSKWRSDNYDVNRVCIYTLPSSLFMSGCKNCRQKKTFTFSCPANLLAPPPPFCHIICIRRYSLPLWWQPIYPTFRRV